MQDIFRSQFRLPADLADKLRNVAEANNRSMNAEIVARLEASFAPQSPAINLRVSGSGTHYGEDGSVREISLEDLARALAAELNQPK